MDLQERLREWKMKQRILVMCGARSCGNRTWFERALTELKFVRLFDSAVLFHSYGYS